MTIMVTPGDDIKDRAISMAHHQLLAIDQQKHEDQDGGQDHSVDHLGNIHDRNEGEIGKEDDPGAEKDHEGVESVELRGLDQFLVNPHLPTQTPADEIGPSLLSMAVHASLELVPPKLGRVLP